MAKKIKWHLFSGHGVYSIYLSKENDVLSVRPNDVVDLISNVSPRQVRRTKACLHNTRKREAWLSQRNRATLDRSL